MIKVSREQLEALQSTLRFQRPAQLLASLQSQGQHAERDPETGDIVITSLRGKQARLAFQPDGLPARLVLPGGGTYQFYHDTSGRPSRLKAPGDRQLEIERDHRGHITRLRRAESVEYGFEHGDQGQLLRVTYPDQSHTQLAYDNTGALTAIVDRAGATTRYLRRQDGRLQRIIDPLGRETRYITDNEGLLKGLVFADGSHEEYCYDRAAKKVTVLRRDEEAVTQSLDSKGRICAIDWAGETHTAFEFDDNDNLKKARNHHGVIEVTSDPQGNPLTEKSPEGSVQYAYDPEGLLTQINTPQGETITYEYDDAGRICKIIDWEQRHASLAYAPDGTVAEIRYSNGLILKQHHSPAGRLESAQVVNLWGKEICRSLYKYDALDRLVLIDERAPNQSFRHSRSLAYDAADRLLSETDTISAAPISRYAYDAKGNLIQDGGISIEVDVHDAPRRVGAVAIEYDRCGNLTKLPGEHHGSIQCTYALDGTLSEATSGNLRLRFEYDAFGRRVSKTDGVRTWRYGWAGKHLLWEEIQERIDAVPVRRDYLFLPGGSVPFAFREHGRTYWLQTDARGAAVRVFDDAGDVVWHATYDSFGSAHVKIALIRQPWRLAGHYLDDETGLYYNFARYYSPWLKTYLSRDPCWYKSEATNYSYARNDPWNRADPWGTIAPLLVVGAIALGAVAGAAIAYFTDGDPVAGAVEGAITVGSAFLGPLGFLAGGFVAGVAGGLIEQYRRGDELCLLCAVQRGALFLAFDLLTLGLSRIPLVRQLVAAIGRRLSRLLMPVLRRLATETIGAFGERAVIRDLERRGFNVLGQIQNNSGHGIDIVARDANGVLHIFEVKTTTTSITPRLSPAQQNSQQFITNRLSRARQAQGHWRNASPETRTLARDVEREISGGANYVTQKADVFLTSSGDEVASIVYSPW